MKYIRMLAMALAIALLPVAAVRAEVTYGTGLNRAGGGNGYEQAQALAERHIPCELHIWPHGHHGLGLAEDLPDIGRWPVLAAEWLRRQGF